MKKLVVLSAFIALTAIGTDVYGYTYTITNYTDKTLLVDVRPFALVEDSKPTFIKPGKTMQIDYSGVSAGLCLGNGSVYVAPVDDQSVLGFTTTIDQAIDALYAPPSASLSPSAQQTAMTEASVVVQTKKIQMFSSLKKITCLTVDNAWEYFTPTSASSDANAAEEVGTAVVNVLKYFDWFTTLSDAIKASWEETVQKCSDATIGIFLSTNKNSYVWTYITEDSWLSNFINSIDTTTTSVSDYLATHAGTSIFGN